MEDDILPSHLRRHFEILLRHHARHLATTDEVNNAMFSAIDSHMTMKTDICDRIWTQPQIDALVCATATSMPVLNGFLASAWRRNPQGIDVALDAIVASVIDGLQSLDDIIRADAFDLVLEWLSGGGRISEALGESLNQAEPLSGAAWLRYLHARNLGDNGTVWQVIEEDLRAGCTASLLVHLDATEVSEAGIRRTLDSVDAARLRDEERWGDLAAIAIFLAERGWFAWAREWGGMIRDERIVPIFEARLGPSHQATLDLSTHCCSMSDASMFAPLAVIDVLAGDLDSAARRVERNDALDYDLGHLSWEFAGHRSMIDWVRSRRERDADTRKQILEGIAPRHVWLGLLGAQISADLAELAVEAGDQARARELRDREARALSKPDVELHGGNFPFDKLLRQLPCNHGLL